MGQVRLCAVWTTKNGHGSSMNEPHTVLEDCLNMLLSYFRKRMSDLHPVVVVAVAALEPAPLLPGVACAVHPLLVRVHVGLVRHRVAADVAHVLLALAVRDLDVLLDVPGMELTDYLSVVA